MAQDHVGGAISVELADSGSNHRGSGQGHEPAHRVNHAGLCVVRCRRQIDLFQGAQPSASPDPVSVEGIDYRADDEAISQVRLCLSPLGDGPGDHARCVASFLTGAHPKKTDGKGISNGVSVDQNAAQAIGQKPRFPSLELGTEPSSQGGRCDSGYSCIYTSNMSWRTPTSPMTKEINPRAVFDRLFGNSDKAGEQKSRAKRDRYRKSILDLVAEDASDLKRKLGAGDVRKPDEFTFAVRQIEKQIEESEKLAAQETGVPDFPRPAGVPRDFGEHVRLMMDMMVLAMQTDSTRTLTFMYTNAGSNRRYKMIGVKSGHHSLSHHRHDEQKMEDITKIDIFLVKQFAYFLEKLKSIKKGDGTLLDNSLILYGSGISDANRHRHHNLDVLVAHAVTFRDSLAANPKLGAGLRPFRNAQHDLLPGDRLHSNLRTERRLNDVDRHGDVDVEPVAREESMELHL